MAERCTRRGDPARRPGGIVARRRVCRRGAGPATWIAIGLGLAGLSSPGAGEEPVLPPGKEKTVPLLVRRLKSPRLVERIEAAKALATVPPAALKEALPDLADALRDEYWDVRRYAAEALRKAGAEAVPVLAKALRRDDYYSRWYAAQTLRRIGPQAVGAVPDLARMLGRGGIDVKQEAALALAEMPDASAAAKQLAAALTDRNSMVRAAVVRALGRTGTATLPQLTELLGHEERGVRVSAAAALGQIGPDAGGAAGALVAVLRSEYALTMEKYKDITSKDIHYSRIRHAMDGHPVIGAVGRLGPAAVGALSECLESDDAELARWVAESLRRIGPDAAAAVPALLGAWKKEAGQAWEWTSVRNQLAGALGAIGPAADPAIPLIAECFRSRDRFAVRPCAYALAAIGPKALPHLVAGLADAAAADRAAAAEALGRMGSAAGSAAPLLRKALKDDDEQVRQQAERALSAVQR